MRVELAGLRHDARVGRVDAVDIGIDVAAIGIQRRGQRDRRGIRPAAAQCGDAVVAARCPGSRRPPRPGRPACGGSVPRRRCRRCAPCHARCRCGSGSASPARSAPRRRSPAARSTAGRWSPARRSPPQCRIRARRAAATAPWHQATSWLVAPAMAETTTATSLPGVDLALHAGGDVADAVEVGDRGAAELHHDAGHRCQLSVVGCGWSYWRGTAGATMPGVTVSPDEVAGSTRWRRAGGTRTGRCGRCTG